MNSDKWNILSKYSRTSYKRQSSRCYIIQLKTILGRDGEKFEIERVPE